MEAYDKQSKIVVKVDPDLSELVPKFLSNRRSDIEIINIGLKKSDYEVIAKLGHIMKGAGSGYGFDAITEIGARLEKFGKEKNPEMLQSAVQELEDYIKRVEVVYE